MANGPSLSRRSALIALGAATLPVAAVPAFAASADPQSDRTLYVAGDYTAAQKHQDVAPDLL